MDSKLVLVTGGGGFLALHVINQFIKEGHKVRATVRNLDDKSKIASIKNAAKDAKNQIEFFAADLLKPETWSSAVKDCDIVMHVASPFPSSPPKDENELIKPAVEGTLNVLKAAFEAKVKRVVVTSSTATIGNFGQTNTIYSEKDWADPDKSQAYQKSKILAEKAAWNFVDEKKNNKQPCFELVVMNPTFILGPTLQTGDIPVGTSEGAVINLLEHKIAKIRPFYVGHCDVRDVALAHYRGAFSAEAVGHRHIIISLNKNITMKTAAEILHAEFGPKGYKIPLEQEPGDDPNNSCDNTRMVKVLGITPTEYKKTIVDMANSLINAGLVKKP